MDMYRKVALLISFVLIVALSLALDPVALADFKLDFNGCNRDNQPGWTPWNNPTQSDQDYTKEFSADFDDHFTIELTNVDWRNRVIAAHVKNEAGTHLNEARVAEFTVGKSTVKADTSAAKKPAIAEGIILPVPKTFSWDSPLLGKAISCQV
jgi:hypothetical protein